MASEDVPPEDAAALGAVSEKLASEKLATGSTTSENATSENTASENETSENETSETQEFKDAEHQGAVPKDTGPKASEPKDAEPKDTKSETVAAETVAPKTVTFNDAVSKDAASEDVSMLNYDSQRERKRRMGIFVKKTTPLPNAAEIAAAVEKENSHAANKQHLVAHNNSGWDSSAPEQKRVFSDVSQWELGMAGPLNNRGLPADLEAQRVIRALEAASGQPLSAKTKAAIWQHHTKNDGAFELIREYGAGRRTVPILGYNRLVVQMDAVRYDSAVEEARLRIKLRASEKLVKDQIENLPRVLDHSKMRGSLASTIGLFQRELERFEIAVMKLHEATYLWPGQGEDDPEPEEGAVLNMNFDAKKVSLRNMVRQLTSLTTALRDMDGAAEEMPANSEEATTHADATHLHVGWTGSVVDMLSQESQIRFSNFMDSTDQHDPQVNEVERHRRHAVVEASRTSLQALCEDIKSVASHVATSRSSARIAIDCVVVQAEDRSLPGYDESMVGIGMVPMRDLERERTRTMKLERRLADTRLKVRTLERAEACRGQNDEQNLYRTIDAYRLFVAQFLRDNMQADMKSFKNQVKELQIIFSIFLEVEHVLQVSPEPGQSNAKLLDALKTIKTSLIPMQEKMEEIGKSLTRTVVELGNDCASESSLNSERWKQAGDATSMQAKDDEISRLNREVARLKNLQTPATDTKAITALLKASDVERERTKQLEDQLATEKEVERALREKVALAEEEVENLRKRLDKRNLFIEKLNIPEADLAKQLEDSTDALERETARARRAEEEVKALETPSRDWSVAAMESGAEGESEVISQLRAEVVQLRSDLESKQDDLDRARATVEDNMRWAEKEAKKKSDQIKKVAEEKLRRLQEELQDANKQKRHLEAIVADAKGNLKNMEKMTKKIELLEKIIAGRGESAHAEFQQLLDAAQAAHDEVVEEKRAVETQLRLCKEIAETCKAKAKTAEEKHKEAKTLSEVLTVENGNLRIDIATLKIHLNSSVHPSDDDGAWTNYDDAQRRRERSTRFTDCVQGALDRAKKRLKKHMIGAKAPLRLLVCSGRDEHIVNSPAPEERDPDVLLRASLVDRRSQVLMEIRNHRVDKARWLFISLQEWLQSTGTWLSCHKVDWMGSYGSVQFLQAYLEAAEAWEARRTWDTWTRRSRTRNSRTPGPRTPEPKQNWLDLARRARFSLGKVLEELDEERNRRAADPTLKVDHETDLAWIKMGVQAGKILDRVHKQKPEVAKTANTKAQQQKQQLDRAAQEEAEALAEMRAAMRLHAKLTAEEAQIGKVSEPALSDPGDREREMMEDIYYASPRSRLSTETQEEQNDDIYDASPRKLPAKKQEKQEETEGEEEEGMLTPMNDGSSDPGAGPFMTNAGQSLDAELQQSMEGSGSEDGSENGSERVGSW